MLSPERFLSILQTAGVNFYAGVPDSLLKEFLVTVQSSLTPERHVICANEGQAVALASGYHLATGEIPLVYMQNSGLGNAINPLTSLCHTSVYSLPMLLLIGWRGQPGLHDEPQHMVMGSQTENLLKCAGIEYATIVDGSAIIEPILARLLTQARQSSSPVALLVGKNVFAKSSRQQESHPPAQLSRADIISAIATARPTDAIFCTTGYASRELYDWREKNKGSHQFDFLNVGAMGHVAQIALGYALAKPDAQVTCVDGDGSAIMHMGGLATIGWRSPAHFLHVVVNNGCHESVGGQPTAGITIKLVEIALACGYKRAKQVADASALRQALDEAAHGQGPYFIEALAKTGVDGNLGRPTDQFLALKNAFMKM